MTTLPRTWLALSLGFALTHSAFAEDRLFDKQFPVNAGGTLTIDTDFGNVTISGSDTNQVTVHAVLKGDQHRVKEFEITATAVNDGVMVRGRSSEYEWFDFSWLDAPSLEVAYTVQIPRNYQVQVHSSRGNLELRDFNGKVFAESSRGNVSISGINGSMQIDSSRGNVHGLRLTGTVKATSSRGNIEIDQVDGPVELYSSRGNVTVKFANVHLGATIESERGNVNIDVPKQFAANLNAHADRGSIDCDLPVTTTAHSAGQHQTALVGTLNGGGKELRVEASRGNITIHAGM